MIDLPGNTRVYDIVSPYLDQARGVIITGQKLSVNYSDRTVSGVVTAQFTDPAALAGTHLMTFTGTLEANKTSFRGTVTSPTLPAGTFVGQVYGPAAEEIGLIFTVLSSDKYYVKVGTLLGKLP